MGKNITAATKKKRRANRAKKVGLPAGSLVYFGNKEKEIQDNISYQKITNSEILQNEVVKEKIEEYMKNLNDKVKNSNNTQKHDKDLDR